MRTLRNVAIIALLAFIVAAVPGGSETAATVQAAISMAFLVAIAWFAYTVYNQQQMTLLSMTDGQRALLFGSIGALALLIVGYEEFRSWDGGSVVWVVLLAGTIALGIVTWRNATTY